MTGAGERERVVAWLLEKADWYQEKAKNPSRGMDGEITKLSELMAQHASVCAMNCLALSHLVERGDHMKGTQADD